MKLASRTRSMLATRTWTKTWSRLLWLMPAIAIAAGVVHAGAGEAEVRNGDAEGALVALDRSYVDAWKQKGTASQAAALLPLFPADAVILPGGGLEPRHGHAEIGEFWFPDRAPPTVVRSFEHAVLGVEIEGGLGMLHGRAALEFEYDGTEVAQEGNYLLAARRQPDGEWKITRLIWNNRTLP
jgi:ketosteroid isomerase-like protein